MSVIRIDLCDKKAIVDSLCLGDIVNGRSGAKFITLKKSQNDKTQLKLQMSSLEDPIVTPFGAKNFGDSDNQKWSLNFDVNDHITDFITMLEEKVQSLAVQNSQSWFKKDTPPKFNSILDSSKPQFPTRLKSKVNTQWVKVWCITEDEDGNQEAPVPGTHEDICGRDHCVPIVKFASIWYVPSTGYGIQTNVTDICVLKKPKNSFAAFDFSSSFTNKRPLVSGEESESKKVCVDEEE